MGIAVKGESHESEPPPSLRSPAVPTNKPSDITLENYASTNGCARSVALMVVKVSKSSSNFCLTWRRRRRRRWGRRSPNRRCRGRWWVARGGGR
ncbi:hypothetical protein ACFX1Z_018714 [Malus domestica]